MTQEPRPWYFNKTIRITDESRISPGTWVSIITQTNKAPGPHQQFFLQYLHEKFRQEHPRYYFKTFGAGAKQSQPETES
jgi:hypothetical protein